MTQCDVLIVGGGPAGSTCARRLVRAGLRVVVLDRATFPRDKVCAGWITPAACQILELDLDEYASVRTLQPFTGFRTGRLDGPMRLTDFGETVSYGIRRCEFDDYLLRRSGAEVLAGRPVEHLRRVGEGWVVNETVHAAMLVGAGGHFCPVARHLQPARDGDAVVAQEIEYELSDAEAARCVVRGEQPELLFWPDLQGYGWCVRKGRHLNVGAGRLNQGEFPAAVREFTTALEAKGLLPPGLPARWKGHAYLLHRNATRPLSGERVVLVGDAAGLALAPSGEGILAAIESGVLAAATIAGAGPSYTRARLLAYDEAIGGRFGPRLRTGTRPAGWPAWAASLASVALFRVGWLTRRWVIEEGFLHRRRPLLT
jgi:flavin-dependent dehydrogenase